MVEKSDNFINCVGPVLQSGPASEAVVRAIEETNREVSVLDRGAYIRVLVPWRCAVSAAAIEKHLGREFRLPADLEMIMTSFKGTLLQNVDEAVWTFKHAGTGDK
jgi:hypothetical protein